MFVKNRESIDFNFRKNGYLAVLKAGTVSYVDDSKVSAKELVACYGQRISIISREPGFEEPQEITEEVKQPEVKQPKIDEVKKEDLNDNFIENILKEIEDEVKVKTPKAPEVKVKTPKAPEVKQPETKVETPKAPRASRRSTGRRSTGRRAKKI